MTTVAICAPLKVTALCLLCVLPVLGMPFDIFVSRGTSLPAVLSAILSAMALATAGALAKAGLSRRG